ncbi:hypothetical protein GCM10010341_86350 [Streptomyces noursei]|nr:hypothetical protein GCM10010341_86350 [Streptomyces noursei]
MVVGASRLSPCSPVRPWGLDRALRGRVAAPTGLYDEQLLAEGSPTNRMIAWVDCLTDEREAL